MVFYRKYRPQTIKDLDSEAVRTKLTAVLINAAPTFIQVPHAFLFTGPKGLGKTSTARIVAKVINCTGRKDTSGKDIEPCNECQQCETISKATNMDIMEIDAASNRGIDEIRDLKEKIRLSPIAAKKKVYIIDEVHMLTTEAFNALLKTLEEPPAHAVFILCTTEAHKIPATILSRCLHITFKLATIDEVVRSLKRVVKGEGIEADEKILKEIAALADGGFRDATKILEELIALSGGKKISPELLEGKYHVATVESEITRLIKALEKRDVKESIESISDLTKQGADIKFFLTKMLDTLHLMLLTKVGVQESNLKTSLSLDELKQLIVLISEALGKAKFAVVPQLPLELAAIEWCEFGSSARPETAALSKKEEEMITKKVESVTVSTLRRQMGEIAKDRAVNGEPKQEKTVKVTREPSEVSILKYTATGDHTEEWMDALWKNIISEMKQHNHTVAGLLRSCVLRGYDRKTLTIQAMYKFHKERLEESKTHAALETVVTQLVGNPVSVTVELKT